MKRTAILLAAMSLSAMAATAQNKVGEFSLKPMIGINVSDITTNEDVTYKSKVGFTGGVEAEYGVTPWLGVSLGALYSQQGAKYEASILERDVNEIGQPLLMYIKMNGKVKVDYINMPLLANFYIYKGLTLKTGVQVGFNVHDKLDLIGLIAVGADLTSDVYNVIDLSTGVPSTQFGGLQASSTDICKSVDFGIPVGISYEYKNITLDARYYFGLTNMNDVEDTEVMHNRVLSITLGYKFKP